MDTMETVECIRIDPDTLTMLEDDVDITEGVSQINDEVEDLRNSLRLAVQDEAVRPKMQCLIMDPSFSMVTVQGEDSGIQWETSSSRCSTPWGSEAEPTPTVASEFCFPINERSVSPGLGSGMAGKITFVMDEAMMVRRPRMKISSGGGCRSRADRRRRIPLPTGDDLGKLVEKPELVEVSLPNVRAKGDGEEEETTDPKEEKKQNLFRLVSEGSEILNIVVPPRLVSIDEEESQGMVDNLSYLEESTFTKPSNETIDEVFEEDNAPPEEGGDQTVEHTESSHLTRPDQTDPPGAPVAKQPRRGATSDMDYFETFTQMDEPAPGGPTIIEEGQEDEEADCGEENQQASEEPEQPQDAAPVTKDLGGSNTGVSGEEISSDHLDEVFYGGMDDMPSKNYLEVEEDAVDKSPKSPLKESGSALFGSEETVLTPIFLPSGPPKIINPTLLEEPTAMAFLYTDLYEEAVGSREGVKEEDTESMTSERSFHSRHSDREARGYLEKFVLKDETPMVELEGEPAVEEGFRTWAQELYTLNNFLSHPDDAVTEGEIQEVEHDMTDFFRTNASSSPSDDRYIPSLDKEKNHAEPVKEDKHVKADNVLKTVQEAPQPQAVDEQKTPEEENKTQGVVTDLNDTPLSDPESSSEGAGGGSVTEPHTDLDLSFKHDAPTVELQTLPSLSDSGTNQEAPKPVAPPRRKPAALPKSSLKLAPLARAQTPVKILEEGVGDGGKEEREEEKEKASPAETADEGEGDGETGQREEEKDMTSPVDSSSSFYQSQIALVSSIATDPAKEGGSKKALETEPVNAEDKKTELAEGNTEPPQAEESDSPKPETDPVLTGQDSKTEPAKGEAEPAESAKPEVEPVKGGGSSETASATTGPSQTTSSAPAPVTDPAKDSGGCIIL
ncbi:cardiomyopathy-associated protein 5 [Coregonus clupeaformis]|uniref:cardiomyopathy-associated protein 5 n=1 Tax=Coregonus clupeaformis TaxID=59861 RepID=UPI001BE04D13|nr:cardiomyopathy-associated protein 5 [Coregonus clupeaformis]